MLSFMWWCQFIGYFKFETHPTSLRNFGTAYVPAVIGLQKLCVNLSMYIIKEKSALSRNQSDCRIRRIPPARALRN